MNSDYPFIFVFALVLIGIIVIYVLRKRLLLFFLNRGVILIQRFAISLIMTINDKEEPSWVLLEYPCQENYTLGLLSRRGSSSSTVFVPSGPRLFPGIVVIIPNNKIKQLKLSFDDGLRLLLTMGLTTESKEISDYIIKQMEEVN